MTLITAFSTFETRFQRVSGPNNNASGDELGISAEFALKIAQKYHQNFLIYKQSKIVRHKTKTQKALSKPLP